MNKIVLSEQQREKLEKLWFIYGNNGKKHTHHNHRFIQNILEHGEDTELFYKNADKSKTVSAKIDWSAVRLTSDCVNDVRSVLNDK